ncbi:unnamed protein product [Schistosoma margrebowiei]|uniref:Uncharacterized protein n=1 Tax=Schistosoma margrebowiei TaxID=48269 RepID=A0A183N4H0_9TREM|nr:unnamed protein product [Schistosoma margrebowiei]
MVVGDSQQETMELGFVLFGTRHQVCLFLECSCSLLFVPFDTTVKLINVSNIDMPYNVLMTMALENTGKQPLV